MYTSIKNHFFYMKGEGMANYEREVEQEAAYPIPIGPLKMKEALRVKPTNTLMER